MKKMPDWLIRAIKTFVQAFFGVLVPEVVAVLQHGWPESWAAVWAYLAPVVAAALAALAVPAAADADKQTKKHDSNESCFFIVSGGYTDRDSASSRPGLCLVRKPTDHSPSNAMSRWPLKSSSRAAPVQRTMSWGSS